MWSRSGMSCSRLRIIDHEGRKNACCSALNLIIKESLGHLAIFDPRPSITKWMTLRQHSDPRLLNRLTKCNITTWPVTMSRHSSALNNYAVICQLYIIRFFCTYIQFDQVLHSIHPSGFHPFIYFRQQEDLDCLWTIL